MQTEISVIIPTHNRKTLLNRTLQSVLNQDCDSFEVIVVDDASVDGTEEMCLALEDSRVQYLRLPQHMGVQVARNKGLHISRGRFVCFFDSDDLMLPGSLSKRLNYFKNHPECECSYSDYEVCFTGLRREYIKKVQIGLVKPNEVYKRVLCTLALAPTGALMAKNEVFQEVGDMDINLPSGHDDDIFLRFAKRGNCHYIPVYAARLMAHAGERITKSPSRIAEGRAMLIEKYKSDIIEELGKKALQHHYLSNAIDFCVAGELYKAKEAIKRASQLGPLFCLSLLVLIGKRSVYFAGRLLRKIIFKIIL